MLLEQERTRSPVSLFVTDQFLRLHRVLDRVKTKILMAKHKKPPTILVDGFLDYLVGDFRAYI